MDTEKFVKFDQLSSILLIVLGLTFNVFSYFNEEKFESESTYKI